jgi:DNA-binding response OmpR family regulator
MEKKQRVLIAEDDQQLGFILKDNLEEEGYAVTYCPDGETAWEEYQRTAVCLKTAVSFQSYSRIKRFKS